MTSCVPVHPAVRASWQFLHEEGLVTEEAGAVHFGSPSEERRAARDASVLVPLTHLAALSFAGADATAFLHAQLTCDVKAVAPGHATLGAYCSPKGRMLASFLLVHDADEWLMLHSNTLTEALRKRLQMFVLRSKVVIGDASDARLAIGVSGPAAHAALEDLYGGHVAPGSQRDGSIVVAVPGERFMVICHAAEARRIWQCLRAHLRPAGSTVWEWLDIRQGIPWITQATQDQLVPQMANFELIGGVSFTKGCYPGQEVVARSQYRGKVRRRMYRARIEGVQPNAGDELFSDDLPGQASGLVVNAQPAPEGGYELLAVAQTSSREESVVRLRAPDGPALRFEPLPYEVT